MINTSCVESYTLKGHVEFITSLGLRPCVDINLNILSDRELFVPEEYASDEYMLCLDISKEAVLDFDFGLEDGILKFACTFSDVIHNVILPIEYVDYVSSSDGNIKMLMANTVTLYDVVVPRVRRPLLKLVK